MTSEKARWRQMLEGFALGFVGGLVASAHCVCMCGAFPVHVARAAGHAGVAGRLLFLVAGKAFTYMFLGALAGFAGQRLVESSVLVDSQRFLAYAVGAAMLLCGLAMLGIRVPALSSRLVPDSGPVASLYQRFIHSPGLWPSGVLGGLMGFLPCPATLAFLAAASGSQSVVGGMAIMLGFGAGTAPALVAVGMGSAAVLSRFKHTASRVAGVVVVLLGLLTALRGADAFHWIMPACSHHGPTQSEHPAEPEEGSHCEDG